MKFAEDFIKSTHPSITDENVQLFIEKARIKTLKKGEVIIKMNQFCTNLYIVNTGVIRSYFIDDKKNEFINSFYTDNTAFASLECLLNNTPSKVAYDCLEDSEIMAIDFKTFKKATHEDLDFAQVYINVLEKVVLERTEKVFDLSTLNATERYLKLKKQIPNIENMVAQYHIASYLSITPVQLSRIRRKLLSK